MVYLVWCSYRNPKTGKNRGAFRPRTFASDFLLGQLEKLGHPPPPHPHQPHSLAIFPPPVERFYHRSLTVKSCLLKEVHLSKQKNHVTPAKKQSDAYWILLVFHLRISNSPKEILATATFLSCLLQTLLAYEGMSVWEFCLAGIPHIREVWVRKCSIHQTLMCKDHVIPFIYH